MLHNICFCVSEILSSVDLRPVKIPPCLHDNRQEVHTLDCIKKCRAHYNTERCKQYIKCRFYLFHCVFIYVLKCKPTFIFSENKDKFILGYSLNNVILDCLEDEQDSFLT